jgi:hypothetical protein
MIEDVKAGRDPIGVIGNEALRDEVLHIPRKLAPPVGVTVTLRPSAREACHGISLAQLSSGSVTGPILFLGMAEGRAYDDSQPLSVAGSVPVHGGADYRPDAISSHRLGMFRNCRRH